VPRAQTGSTSNSTSTAIPFVGAFESTFLPSHDIDVAETSSHATRWRADLDANLAVGVNRFRYPLRWHRIERERGRYDWSETDDVLGYLGERQAEPIVDLLHHTSYPQWLTDGFRDRAFPAAYLSFTEAVATRYPWLRSYTLFNEPLATLFLAGHEALWPPYDHGVDGFVRLARNVLPAVSAAASCFRELLPEASHIWIDTCEHHAGTPGGPANYAAWANDRRHVLLDLAIGHDLNPSRPFLAAMLEAGAEPLLSLPPIQVDVLGLDYYCHSEWWYEEGSGRAPSPHPVGFAAVAEQYARRYQLPMLLSETNIRGLPSDRASWLRYMLEQYQIAVSMGVPLSGFCWFPSVDSCDWDSLLARPGGRPDPVGVLSLGRGGSRMRTPFTDVWEAAVAGAAAAELPAYRFQPPCDSQLTGFVEQLGHWPWQEPPSDETPTPIRVPSKKGQVMATSSAVESRSEVDVADLVVLSHLKWTWVWQRPQHLVSRFAKQRAISGAQTWFVEEPVAGDVTVPQVKTEKVNGVVRAWLVIPHEEAGTEHLTFDAPGSEHYGELLATALQGAGVSAPEVLLYTPMALDIALELSPTRLFYDVMDDLASFRNAPPGLALRQRRALAMADAVFTGGRSLHRSVAHHRRGPCYLFPSGVDSAHFASTALLREEHERPVAGYVGVLDERVDHDLVKQLAEALPDWTIRMVGPVAKIDPEDLPSAPNLEYPGRVAYQDLPKVFAGLDVALMPFARNEATRAISPTKTLEYLAAGLPVVSTPIADVVTDYSDVVVLAENAAEFAGACRTLVSEPNPDRVRLARSTAMRHEWDAIASRIAELMARSGSAYRVSETSA
jgi:beta-glucosidase/6-phospho-beta-glucosidase/beta-galactosidase